MGDSARAIERARSAQPVEFRARGPVAFWLPLTYVFGFTVALFSTGIGPFALLAFPCGLIAGRLYLRRLTMRFDESDLILGWNRIPIEEVRGVVSTESLGRKNIRIEVSLVDGGRITWRWLSYQRTPLGKMAGVSALSIRDRAFLDRLAAAFDERGLAVELIAYNDGSKDWI